MRANRGITLIELMIVVAVIAILGAVAYPSYQSYIIRAKRSAAQQLMLKIANRQEQYMLDRRQYTATLGSGGLNIVEEGWTCSGTTCSNDRYDVTSPVDNTATPPTYTVTAVPKTGTPQASDGTLTLNNLGSKTRGGTSGW